MKTKFKNLSLKGFTLIELLVVIAVLGVLAAAVVAAINPLSKIQSAKDSNLKSDVSAISNALQSYYTGNTQVYPATLSVLTTNELKILPVQQASATNCTSISPAGAQGAAANYCYGTDSAQKAVVWAKLFNPTGIGGVAGASWCWDSTNGVTRLTTTSGEPTVAGGYVCP